MCVNYKIILFLFCRCYPKIYFHGSAQNEKEKSFSFQIWKRFVFNVRFQIRVHTSYKLGFKPLSNFKQVWIQFSKHFETAFKFQANFKLNFKTVSYQISNCFQISNLLEIKSQTSLKSDFKPLSHYKLAFCCILVACFFLDSKGNKFQFHSQFYNFCSANLKKSWRKFWVGHLIQRRHILMLHDTLTFYRTVSCNSLARIFLVSHH